MKTKVEVTSCDFCGYGSPYSQPEDFQQRPGGVDLCRWCMNGRQIARMECGGHVVTFREAGGWDCDCGMNTDRWPVQSLRILTRPEVLAVLPSFDNATATQHVEGRLR